MRQVPGGLILEILSIVVFANVVVFWANDSVFSQPHEPERPVVILKSLDGLTDEDRAHALGLLNKAADQEGIDLFLSGSPHFDYQLWGEVDASREANPNKILYAWVAYDRHGRFVGTKSMAIASAGAAPKGRPLPKIVLQAIARAAFDVIRQHEKLVAGDAKMNR